jgi:transposase
MLNELSSEEHSGGGDPPVRFMEVVSGPEGRRRWSREAKARIIEETLMAGVLVAEVARRHGLRPQHLYNWRSLARVRAPIDEVGFVPAIVETEVLAAGSLRASIVVQAGDLMIHVPATVDVAHIERVLTAARVGR